jgi:nucleoside-diphosphate-sugar epimerase
MSRRVLITGGSGFVGKNLVEYLKIHTDDHVTVLDRIVNSSSDVMIEDDIVNLLQPQYSHLNFDIIFHLADYRQIQESNPLEAVHTNTYGMAIICEIARRSGPDTKVIHMIMEPNRPIPSIHPYTISKKTGSEILQMYCHCYRIHGINVHLRNIYGPGEPTRGEFSTPISKYTRQFQNHEPIRVCNDLKQLHDFVHVEDVCRGLVLLSMHPNITHCPDVEFQRGQLYTTFQIINLFYSHAINDRDYVITAKITIPSDIHPNPSIQLISPNFHGTLVEWKPIHTLSEYIASLQ